MRRVPLPPQTTEFIADYLAEHPRRDDPTAPLFPRFTKPTGKRALDAGGNPAVPTNQARARRQAERLAELTVFEAESRLRLDWSRPLQHGNFYKAVFRPAVLRANRMFPTAALPPGLRFHSLRHTYASLCGEGGISVRQVASFMGHANPTTTEHIYTHVYKKADHADDMGKLDAVSRPAVTRTGNVIPLRR